MSRKSVETWKKRRAVILAAPEEVRARLHRSLAAIAILTPIVLATVLTGHLLRTSAEEEHAIMTLEAPDVVCGPTSCMALLDSTFTVAVSVEALPAGGDYLAFQSELFYGGLAYEPALSEHEIVWPDGALPVRSPALPSGDERLVAHGDVSGLLPPYQLSNHTGAVVEVALRCPDAPAAFDVALLPFDEAGRPLGAGFKLLDEAGALGETVPAKTAGQRALDLDGDEGTAPETVEIADALVIECVESIRTATATRSPTPTHTPTPTNTPTPAKPRGDANCDQTVTSIDAALTLQLVAGLLGALACPAAADVNDSGSVNAIDAALMLQITAGLLAL